MPEARLNVAALRLRRLPGSRPGPDPSRSLTRRELLGAAGAAAAVISPAVRAIGDTLHGPFQLNHENGRAAFEFAGQERWVVDPADFGGKPDLQVEQAERLIKLTLTGATYPGTELPADFTCEIKQGLTGWKMKLRHSLGGFSGQAPFERWLTGQADLESSVKVNAEVCSLGGEAPVKLDGRAHAAFRPDGFRFRGEAFAQIEGENSLAGDRVELTLLRDSDPSVFEEPASSRTLLTLHREGRHWPLRPVADDLPAGELSCYSDAFETLRIEIAPGATSPSVALLAESGTSHNNISFRPHSKLQAANDSPFELKLRNARYAVAFESEGPHTALVADYDRPSWMHAEGCSVLVGDGPNASPFEIVGRSGKTESMTVSPALLGFVAPLAGAIVEPSPMPEGSVINFEPEQVKASSQIRPQAGIAAQAKLNPLFAHIGLLLPGRIRVVRPEDMLALQFVFINLRFQTGAGGPVLTRMNPAQAAYLVVVFPPQHIAEEAGEETTGSNGQQQFKAPPFMPVRSRIAGESRLAFLVPSSVTSIPYTIDGLLDWEKLVPSVVPNADPPPAPMRLPDGRFQLPGGISASRMSAEIDDDNAVRFTKTAMKAQARSLDLSHLALSRPKISALTPLQTPAFQTAPKLGPAGKVKPGISIQAGNIISLLQSREIREPLPYETAIEAPWRLILSPHDLSGWAHESDVSKVTHNGRTELWHTRLGTLRSGKVDEDDDYYRVVRAVWSPDFVSKAKSTAPDPTATKPQNDFLTSLSVKNRHEIVRQSSDYLDLIDEAKKRHDPKPIPAKQFTLTSLGAFLDMHGKWEAVPGQVDLEEWIQRSQMGRDNFVRVVEAGYLMPFGHRAVLVKITERKFFVSEGQRFAMLFQRMFVEIKEPERTFPGSQMRDGGNRLPFTRVIIKTKRTPDMEIPMPEPNQSQFFPIVAGSEFRFHLEATDKTGRESEFSMPLMFVKLTRAHTESGRLAIQQYNSHPDVRRSAAMQGQQVGFAPASVPGDTVLDTERMVYKADALAGPLPNRCTFYPAMATADVSIPAARAIADSAGTVNVEYPDIYSALGFGGANAEGQIYLRLTGGKVLPLRYDSTGKGERAGGMATPNMSISGLSRRKGVVGGPIPGVGGANRALPVAVADRAEPSPWKFNPADFFGEKAKLLGFLALKEIIPKEMGGDGRNAPKLTNKVDPDRITTTLEWKPDLNAPVLPAPLDKLFLPLSTPQGGKYVGHLEIKCELVTYIPFNPNDVKEPTYDILGRANNFTMDIFECIELKFEYVKFTAKSGAGVDVDPKFGSPEWIKFKGPLSFVNKLKDLLPGSGSSRALVRGESKDLFEYYIDPSPSGIKAGFTINVPSVAIGVFSLQNIGVGADIDIPFTGDPLTLTFNFCSRDNQFLLTVWIFGGGGFFNLKLGLDGIIGFEAGFQFGVAASISFGIASGGVSVMAGFSYDYERVEKSTNLAGEKVYEGKSTLVGYFEANGWVDVLGLISASLELYLGLEYTSQGDTSELWGTARITFKIEILFLSFEVSAEVEKRFAGSGPSSRALPPAGNRAAVTSAMGGVKFEQIYSEPEWNEYCLAFA